MSSHALTNSAALAHRFYGRFLSVRTLEVPLIAAINGPAIGALYTYGPSYRFSPKGTAADVAARVLAHADEINRQLGSMDAVDRVSEAS